MGVCRPYLPRVNCAALKLGKKGPMEGGGRRMENGISKRGARSRKRVAKPDGYIARVDTDGRVRKAGPSGQVEKARC
eukprot:3129084-Pyramimonas_sp.AAC.1